jgi:arylsulfatase A-like enzyme
MLGYGKVADRYPFEMPRALKDAGYTTVSVGKDHFGWNTTADHGIDHGYTLTQLYDGLGSGFSGGGEYDNYDRWFQKEMPGKDPMATGLDWNTWHGAAYVYDEYYHPTAWVARTAIGVINKQNASSPPWFMKVSFHRPHSPYDPPARLLNATKLADLAPMITGGNWDQRFRGLKGDPPGCGPTTDAWCGLMPTNDSDLSRRSYYASVAFVDENIGHIMTALEAKGMKESTFILFTGDHGDGQGDHHHWRKGYPYEFSSHVPFLVRWPESMQGGVVKVPRGTIIKGAIAVELRDVAPTMLAVAGLGQSVGAGLFKPEDGKPVTCLLTDPTGATACEFAGLSGPWRKWLDLEHSTCYNGTNHWSAITNGEMKYVYKAWNASEQLFNTTGTVKARGALCGVLVI